MSWSVVNLRPFNGDGSYGELYLGERTDNGETVVVKYLRDYMNPDARRYFKREFKILSRGLHGALIPAIAGRPDAERPYYIMPYFRLGPLTPWAGRLTHDQLLAAAKVICEGIAAMHAADIEHGDIKPDNIMVTAEGDLRVGDPLGNGAGCTVMLGVNRGGTPGYWAEEIRNGGAISKAGDVYSIGATLFHLATGRRPVDDQNLDPQANGVLTHKLVRAAILAACSPQAWSRPTVTQLLAILNGRQWNQPKKPGDVKDWIATAGIAAGIVLLIIGLAKK